MQLPFKKAHLTLPQLDLKTATLSMAMVFVMLLSACSNNDALEKIKQSGKIVVVTRNSPTTYFLDKNGATGFEYQLAYAFAQHLGVDLEIITEHNLEKMFNMLQKSTADVAAAGLTITPERLDSLYFSKSYQSVDQHLIYQRGTDIKRPKSVQDVIGKRLQVIANSSHAETLQSLQTDLPNLHWEEALDLETLDLLELVENRQIDYTIIDSNEFLANQGVHRNLRIAFNIGEKGDLAWALAKNAKNKTLLGEINHFMETVTTNGTLEKLMERHFGHTSNIRPVDSVTFRQAINSKLPRYRALIETVAADYEVDWRLVAAIAYQESYWNPKAKSPTGVRGMMMLTRTTAKEMQITKRTDAEQSLRGGVRYFKKLYRSLPGDIDATDRTWFSLAAYNIGLGHAKDIRKLTAELGGNPNRWSDVEKNLPLLTKRKYYENTKYGYARGREAKTYVRNIRHYYNMLSWIEFTHLRTRPPINVSQLTPSKVNGSLLTL